MSKCLITKLSEKVANNNLPVVGEIKVVFENDLKKAAFWVKGKGKITADTPVMTLTDESALTSELQLAGYNQNIRLFASAGTTIRISDKYSLGLLGLPDYIKEIGSLTCLPNITDFTVRSYDQGSYDITKILPSNNDYTSVTIILPNGELSGNLDHIINPNLLRLITIANSDKTEFDVTKLYACTSLLILQTTANQAISINDLAEGQVANGRTSGTLAVSSIVNGTYQSEKVTSCNINFDAEGYSVTNIVH